MAKTYPITEEQKKFLNTFCCERLKSDPTNRWLIQEFYHPDGQGLVNKIRNCAWEEDHLGKTAYYVIKNASNQIVMIFSLKCGTLFNPNAIARWRKTGSKKTARQIWNDILTPKEIKGIKSSKIYDLHLPQMLSDYSMNDYRLLLPLSDLHQALGEERFAEVLTSARVYLHSKKDQPAEPNKNIVLVPDSYPAIELVEFCSNYETRHCWNTALMGKRRMGETLFWWFIAPTILQIGDSIGCEYVFLFAANNEEKDRMKSLINPVAEGATQEKPNSLVSYYHSLHFKNDPKLGTAKPSYDYECQFLCQRLRVSKDYQVNDEEELDGMDSHQKHFFWEFNVEEEEDIHAFDYV